MSVKFIPKEEQQKEERTYKIGDTFKFNNSSIYQLIAVNGNKEAQLICLMDGNRWSGAKGVSNLLAITQEELGEIMGALKDKFTQINITITED